MKKVGTFVLALVAILVLMLAISMVDSSLSYDAKRPAPCKCKR